MLHETTVHRADVELAAGLVPDVDPVVAADGIEEFLANLPTARRPSEHLGSLPAGASLHLHATDCGWRVADPDRRGRRRGGVVARALEGDHGRARSGG